MTVRDVAVDAEDHGVTVKVAIVAEMLEKAKKALQASSPRSSVVDLDVDEGRRLRARDTFKEVPTGQKWPLGLIREPFSDCREYKNKARDVAPVLVIRFPRSHRRPAEGTLSINLKVSELIVPEVQHSVAPAASPSLEFSLLVPLLIEPHNGFR